MLFIAQLNLSSASHMSNISLVTDPSCVSAMCCFRDLQPYKGCWMVLWKMRSLGKFSPTLGILHNLIMGLGVSHFVSVGHIFAFLSSHYTFSSWARILKCKSRGLGESQIYHSPPLIHMTYSTVYCRNHAFHWRWICHDIESTIILRFLSMAFAFFHTDLHYSR